MKVLMINGSPRKGSNTGMALEEMTNVFATEDIESEIIQIGHEDIRGCISCYSCMKTGKCVFDDKVNETAPKFEEADGIVLASPVYYATPNGSMVSFCDRLFLSTRFSKAMKVGAAVAVARRAGVMTTLDVLNKYFGISNMPIAPSNYWNLAFGRDTGDVAQDEEGMQTMRILAQNMAFMMKSIAEGKKKYGMPEYEQKMLTNFIR